MSLATINNILLRTKIDPNLSAKGSSVTWLELDDNLKIIRDAIVELSTASTEGFDAYNNLTVYNNTDPSYVVYDGNIWEFINPTPAAGVTPGTDILTWQIVSQGLFSHLKNRDQFLDETGVNEVSASSLRALLDSYTSDLADVLDLANDYTDIEIAGIDLTTLWNKSGNTLSARGKLGATSGDFGFDIVKNNVTEGGLSNDASWFFGLTAKLTDTFFSVKSTGNTTGTYTQKWQNDDGTELFFIRDDGSFGMRGIMYDLVTGIRYFENRQFYNSSDFGVCSFELSALQKYNGGLGVNVSVCDWANQQLIRYTDNTTALDWDFMRLYRDWTCFSTGGFMVPVGTTGQRLATQGAVRYNTTTSKFEGYDGSSWNDFH